QPHFEGLETAFLQLSFAIKLWYYFDTNRFDKELFDIPLTIQNAAGTVCLPHNEFATFDHLLVATENNISICFGAAAITLWEALKERNGCNPPTMDPNHSPDEMLASLSYMLRCCFAHGTAVPRWQINEKYRVVYKVGNKSIDLKDVDGLPFEYSAIDGFETLWLLRADAQARGML
ncbi:MAG: hypothetical protein ACREJ0_28135, partial [Geminicoccaceae bacterium]